MENEKETTNYFSPELEHFITEFQSSQVAATNRQADNDRISGPAMVYEKIRTALEYQEEHHIFKNAIARIISRKYAFTMNPSAKRLVSDLISELSWANYINPENIKPEEYSVIIQIVDRYLVFLREARSGFVKKGNLQKMIIQWMACEINELFHPEKEREVFLNYTSSVIGQNLSLEQSNVSPEENLIQLKIAIYSLVMKPDFYLIQYWLLKAIYPNWATMSLEDAGKIARSFDPYYNKINHSLNHPYRKNYLLFVKRNISPFTLLYRVLMTDGVDLEKLRNKPQILHTMMMDQYDRGIKSAKDKVWRGTFRALIFIFVTKISLAFLLEIPFDKFFSGHIDFVSLIINVTLPPLLMLAAGTFVKSPPSSNYRTVSEAATNLITKGTLLDKKVSLLNSKTSTLDNIFNSVYFLITFGILLGVIWLLAFLKFNIISITLFFVFVSAVSFFSFRIRNIALELAMKRNDDTLTSALEFIFLPFIRIGRFLSDRIAAFNPFIIALDFLIEAPLKTIIKITNSWLRFINSKKEDLEF